MDGSPNKKIAIKKTGGHFPRSFSASAGAALWRGRVGFFIAIGIMLFIVGCGSPGLIRWTFPDNSVAEVRQPSDPTKPATLMRSPDGTVSISTGAQQEQTPAMIAAGKTWYSYIVGAILILAGVGMLIGKAYLPLIPTSAGTYTMLAGGAVIVLATVSVSIPWWAWLIVGGAGLVIIGPGIWANKKVATQTAAHAAGAT